MQEKSGEKLNIFSFSATSFIAMDRYESVDLFQAPVNSNNLLQFYQIPAGKRFTSLSGNDKLTK
jgi:hypothetical protein